MQIIKSIVEPIFKKYGMQVNERGTYYYIGWSYSNNTVVWKGKTVPHKVEDVIKYYEDGELYIFNIGIMKDRLEKMSIDKLGKYIDSVIGLYINSRVFDDKKFLDYLVPKGKFYCWKQGIGKHGAVRLVKLEVPAKAKRYQALNEHKFRVSEAKVVGIYNGYKKETDDKEVSSCYNHSFKYRVGEVVKPDKWDETDTICSNGIHAFMRFDDAKNY